ncbi:MAG: MlaD family protein [Pseudomonadota bacterium]|nr:MlaD family protein [Pseudomonadota bacterium]
MSTTDSSLPPGWNPDRLPSPQLGAPPRWKPALIWMVPAVAALIAIALAVRALLNAGVDIYIDFKSATGLEPGKTEVRYKDVLVGMVKGITLSDDLESVKVHVELDRRAESLAVEDTRFWIVRPRVDTGGISGLDTLLSGVYLSIDVGESTVRQRSYKGLDTPPAVTRDSKGTSYVLHSTNLGSLGPGSPVYFRRIAVGRVGAYELDANGTTVTLQIFVDAPYDKFVTEKSHFWNASGVDLSISASGLQLNTESLASVVAGGIAFASSESGTQASAGTEYWLHKDRKDAEERPSGPPLRVAMRFSESLRGLAVGAPVDFRGVELGQVDVLELEYDAEAKRFVGNVFATIYPQRLGHGYETLLASSADAKLSDRDLLSGLVRSGLRAQLRSGNLLTGQLYIALDMVAKPSKNSLIAMSDKQVLGIPTEPGSLAQLQTQIATVVDEISQVPFGDLGVGLRDTLASTDALIKRLDGELTPEATKTLASARRAIDAANSGLLAGDGGLQQDMRQTLNELERAGRSLRALADYLQRHPEALIRGKRDSDDEEVATEPAAPPPVAAEPAIATPATTQPESAP